MPIYLLILGVQVLCAVHVGRTGRPYYWITLIMFVPVAGMLAYFIMEILPELLGSRTARAAASGVVRILDPEKAYREARRQVQIASSTDTKANLAEQCLRSGRHDEAIEVYRDLLTGMHATEPGLMLGLARTFFAKADYAAAQDVLDRLREANPEYRSADGHLLYARCLELQGKNEDALFEYAALAGYYPGQEAKSRWALLLRETGRFDEARRLFEEVCQAVELLPRHAKRAQREWYDFAKRHLAAQ